MISLKRNIKKRKYVIVLKKKGSKNRVVEKLGSYSTLTKCLVINPFRLIYLVSKGSSISGSTMFLLFRYKIIG
jgi:hypothetical protein